MNFIEFVAEKTRLLQEQPDLLDLSETRISKGFARYREEEFHPDDLPEKSHRCHLAEYWLDWMKWSRDMKPRTLVSQGVRHSLETLMSTEPNFYKIWVFPDDTYPVYFKLAEDIIGEPSVYTSYPISNIPDGDFLLLCHPSKPRTEPFSMAEQAIVMEWLAKDSTRRIVIDAVYTYSDELDNFTIDLLATNQAIYLSSLSKSFRFEKMLGICVVPEQDVELYTPVFRALSWNGDKENFRKAEFLLRRQKIIPMMSASAILTANVKLKDEFKDRKLKFFNPWPTSVSYLHVVPYSWNHLLDQGILAIPYSVFCTDTQFNECPTKNLNLSVVSSLNFI